MQGVDREAHVARQRTFGANLRHPRRLPGPVFHSFLATTRKPCNGPATDPSTQRQHGIPGAIAIRIEIGAAALAQYGYFGILALHFQTFGGMQVLADLVVTLGSFSTLLYLLTRKPLPTRA